MMEKNTNESELDVAVIGAGQAGLSISYCLKQQGLRHLVFEKARIGETWRSQRWDSFAMNTANKNNILPGINYSGNNPEGFCTANEFVTILEAYSSQFQLPVLEYTPVISVERSGNESLFTIAVSENGNVKTYHSKQLVITSGNQNGKKIPFIEKNISGDILQLHASEYRNVDQLPEGAVLVIGSAQSGCQIAEDLADKGRNVYLSTSMVARIPRRYRGKDIVDWLAMMDFFKLKTEVVTDPKVLAMKVPLLSGIGELGHTLSFQLLAKKGVCILGRMENADDQNIYFATNADQHVKFADGFSQKVKLMVDDFIIKNQLSAPPAETDMADEPDVDASCASSVNSLNFIENNIKTIIWTTGFNGNFNYLKLPVIDDDGNPKHKNGVSELNGLYFLGLPWLRMRKSGMIFGIIEDAAFITEELINNMKNTEQTH